MAGSSDPAALTPGGLRRGEKGGGGRTPATIPIEAFLAARPGAGAPLTPSIQGGTSFAIASHASEAGEGTPLEAGDAAARAALQAAVADLSGGEAKAMLAAFSALRTPVTEAGAERDLSSGDISREISSAAASQGWRAPKALQAWPAAAPPSLTREPVAPKAPQAAPAAVLPRSPISPSYEQRTPDALVVPLAQGQGTPDAPANPPTPEWGTPDAPADPPNQGPWSPDAPADPPNQELWAPDAPADTPNQGQWAPDAPADPPNQGQWAPDAPVVPLPVDQRTPEVPADLVGRVADGREAQVKAEAKRTLRRHLRDQIDVLNADLADKISDDGVRSGAATLRESADLIEEVTARLRGLDGSTVYGGVHFHRTERDTRRSQYLVSKPDRCKVLEKKLLVPCGKWAEKSAVARTLAHARTQFIRDITHVFEDAGWDLTAEDEDRARAARLALFSLVQGSVRADRDRLAEWRGHSHWARDELHSRNRERVAAGLEPLPASLASSNYAWFKSKGLDVREVEANGRDVLAYYVGFLANQALGVDNVEALRRATRAMWTGLKFYRSVFEGGRRVRNDPERFYHDARRCFGAFVEAQAEERPGIAAPDIRDVRYQLLEALPPLLRQWAEPARRFNFGSCHAPRSTRLSERGHLDLGDIRRDLGTTEQDLSPEAFLEEACARIAAMLHGNPDFTVWRENGDEEWLEEPAREDLAQTVDPAGGNGARRHWAGRQSRNASRRNSAAGADATPRMRSMNTQLGQRPSASAPNGRYDNGYPKPRPEQVETMRNDHCFVCEAMGVQGSGTNAKGKPIHGHHHWCCPVRPKWTEPGSDGS